MSHWDFLLNPCFKDMDLLNEQRQLIHTGKVRQGFDLNGWGELFVLLFDNYSQYHHILC
jgi:hypothetical protein